VQRVTKIIFAAISLTVHTNKVVGCLSTVLGTREGLDKIDR